MVFYNVYFCPNEHPSLDVGELKQCPECNEAVEKIGFEEGIRNETPVQ